MKDLLTSWVIPFNSFDSLTYNFDKYISDLTRTTFELEEQIKTAGALVEIKMYLIKPNAAMGRPKKDFDVEEASRLRLEEKLTYQEIADRFNTSLFNIYNKLPKEVREATKHLELRWKKRERNRKRREEGIRVEKEEKGEKI